MPESSEESDETQRCSILFFAGLNDGRPHLKQVLPVLKAGKQVFIDKPVAGSLRDAIAIYDEAKRLCVPVFSSSSLRFSKEVKEVANGSVGKVVGCDAYSSCPLEPTQPNLLWYGIHGVETLLTITGPGCQSVTRTITPGTDFVVGVWDDVRVAIVTTSKSSRSKYQLKQETLSVTAHLSLDPFDSLVCGFA